MTQPNRKDNKNNNNPHTSENISNPSSQEKINSGVTPVNRTISLEKKVDKLGNFSLNMLRSIALWRLVGYVLLFLFVLDLAEIMIPPRFFNPQWEFQVLGQIVERVPIPFLAFILIFYGGKYLRKTWEYVFLTAASWLTLLIGILFILAVPLGIVNTIRIDKQTQATITEATNQRLEVLQQVETRLKDVQNREQMQVLIGQLNRGNAPVIENEEQLQQAQSNLKEFVETSRNQLDSRAKAAKKQRRRSLLKRSVKWNIGALVSGILFVITWNMTKWARTKETMNEV